MILRVIGIVAALLVIAIIFGCSAKDAPYSCETSKTCIDTGTISAVCLDNKVYDRQEEAWTLRKDNMGAPVGCR